MTDGPSGSVTPEQLEGSLMPEEEQSAGERVKVPVEPDVPSAVEGSEALADDESSGKKMRRLSQTSY